MTDNKTDNFNIEPLVFEIENVIKKGLNKILKDYVNRTELLENANKQILSVLNELNNDEPFIQHKEDTSLFVNVKDMTQKLVNEEVNKVEETICYIEDKLEKLEKNYDTIVEILDKIFHNVKTLNEDVKLLKTETNSPKEEKQTSSSIKPLIVSACENENIKFEINEETDDKHKEKDVKQLLLESEEEEEEISDEEEPDEKEEVSDEEEPDEKEEISDEEVQDEKEKEPEEEQRVIEQEQEETEEIETECSEEEEDAEDEEVEEVKEKNTADETEEEFFEIEIDDVTYCTNNEENGIIYQLSEDGDIGEKIGYLKEGEPFFYADEN
jgi:cobalamin biosynthesis protein CobT